MSDVSSGRTGHPTPLTAAELVRYFGSAVATLLVVAAVFLAWRRLAGALAAPLPAAEMLAAAALLAGLAWLAHASLRERASAASHVLVSLAALLFVVSLSRGGGNPLALIVLWVAVLGEEAWAWRGRTPHRVPASGYPVRSTVSEDESSEPAADIMRQLTLRSTAEGGQELSGWLRMPLAAGQRSGSLHVAFVPAFDRPPQVQAEAVSGPDCRIKTAEALPYGVRLDIKLDAPAAEAESVLLWFFAGK